MEDYVHDWTYNKDTGAFKYYTCVANRADVLIVYEFTEESVKKFDPMTGKPIL